MTDISACRFQWVECQLTTLKDCPNLASVRQALRSLPKTLDDHYERIVCSIPEGLTEYALTILRWLSFALTPVTLGTLQGAVAVNIAGNPWFDDERVFPDPKDLLAICTSLVEIQGDSKAPKDAVVRLAHFSVKEYLTSARIQASRAGLFFLSEAISHEVIAATCLAYLLWIGELDMTNFIREDHDMFLYAMQRWTQHTNLLAAASDRIKSLGIKFLRLDNPSYRFWIPYSQHPARTTLYLSLEAHAPLYMMVAHGVKAMVKELLDLGCDPNDSSATKPALSAAIQHGRSDIVTLLLQYGADPNRRNRFGVCHLQQALHLCNLECAKALIDAGAWINVRDEDKGRLISPLICLCKAPGTGQKKPQIARLLLNNGADIHYTTTEFGNALHTSCAQPEASLELIKVLVEEGISTDEIGGKYGTVLQALCAHEGNDDAICYMLPRSNIRSFVPGSIYGTALHAACAESHDNVEIVQLLVQNGADPSSFDGAYSVLTTAVKSGNEKIKRFLLQNGCVVDLNSSVGLNNSVLHTATQ